MENYLFDAMIKYAINKILSTKRSIVIKVNVVVEYWYFPAFKSLIVIAAILKLIIFNFKFIQI